MTTKKKTNKKPAKKSATKPTKKASLKKPATKKTAKKPSKPAKKVRRVSAETPTVQLDQRAVLPVVDASGVVTMNPVRDDVLNSSF